MKKHTKICLLLGGALLAIGIGCCVGGLLSGSSLRDAFERGLFNYQLVELGGHIGFSGERGQDEYSGNGEYSIGTEEIDSLTIEWVSGTVTIGLWDGESIKFSEERSGVFTKELDYFVSDGTLHIKYSRNTVIGPSIGNKSLTVLLPRRFSENINRLKIDSTSAEITVLASLTADNVEIDTVSGSVEAPEMTVKKDFRIETVSGYIEVCGNFRNVKCHSVSGSVNMVINNEPNELKFDTTSGYVYLLLPGQCGYTAELDSVSGFMECVGQYYSRSGEYVYGSGECDIEMDSVSGDLRISVSNTDYTGSDERGNTGFTGDRGK